jgi:hypothetical protein
MKLSTSQIILQQLESNPTRWFKSWELNQSSTPYGWIGAAGSRRARGLARENKIEVRHIGKYAEYHYKEKELPKPEPTRPPSVLPHFAKEFISQQVLFS